MSHDKAQWITALLTALVLTAPNIAVSAATIVYDNTTFPVTGGWTPHGFWPFSVFAPYEPMGDEITLAGTARTITGFDLILSSTQEITLDALTLSFYKNDGLDGYGNPGAPGTDSFWTETIKDVTVNDTTTVPFSIPNVLVPDTFTWITSADSLIAGMATYDPPTVGSSGDYYWDRFDEEWWGMWFENDPVANFGARVIAVPEPTTLALLVLGGLSAIRRRRP